MENHDQDFHAHDWARADDSGFSTSNGNVRLVLIEDPLLACRAKVSYGERVF